MPSEADLDKLVLTTFSQTIGDRGILEKTWTEYIRDENGKQLALQNGLPDLVGHIEGLHVEIEDKKFPNRPTAQQYARLRRVNATGGLAAMIVLDPKGEVWWVPPIYIQNFDFSWKDKPSWTKLGTITGINMMQLLVESIERRRRVTRTQVS